MFDRDCDLAAARSNSHSHRKEVAEATFQGGCLPPDIVPLSNDSQGDPLGSQERTEQTKSRDETSNGRRGKSNFSHNQIQNTTEMNHDINHTINLEHIYDNVNVEADNTRALGADSPDLDPLSPINQSKQQKLPKEDSIIQEHSSSIQAARRSFIQQDSKILFLDTSQHRRGKVMNKMWQHRKQMWGPKQNEKPFKG